MVKVILIAVLSLIVVIGLSGAADVSYEEIERRLLYTACAPMDLVVEELPPEAPRETGLTQTAIINAVESRLRAARLFVPIEEQELGRQQYLYTNVNISGSAFSIDVELNRNVEDLGYGLQGVVTVWKTGRVGTHNGDGQYILGNVSRHLDTFIASYLRVNEVHCAR